MKETLIVHDDLSFVQAIRLYYDGFDWITEERAMKDSGQSLHYRKVVLVKCHKIWPELPANAIVIHDGDITKYRGCSPLRHALSNGERQIVVTALRPTGVVDYGWVLGKQVFSVPETWEPFCAVWHRSARAYAELLLQLSGGADPVPPAVEAALLEVRLRLSGGATPVAPPPTMGTIFNRFPTTVVYEPGKMGSETLFWGLRACGSVPGFHQRGLVQLGNRKFKVRWAELGGTCERHGLKPGEYRRELGKIVRVGCGDWRTMLLEVEE